MEQEEFEEEIQNLTYILQDSIKGFLLKNHKKRTSVELNGIVTGSLIYLLGDALSPVYASELRTELKSKINDISELLERIAIERGQDLI